MSPTIRKGLKKSLIILSIGFTLLFVFRMIYGYNKKVEPILFQEQINMPEIFLEIRKNYASKEYKANYGQSQLQIDQKYEKIANINTSSTSFDKEEKQIRKQIKNYNGLIQFENKNGNKGYRKLNLIIGIPPENFDSIYNSLTKIGSVQSKEITKKDKTNEYRELNAKKSSLEKIKQSLLELKSKGGKIEEFMQLENRILEIEQQLQELGVSLGNFDDENEFCTVKFSLSERKEITVGLLQQITDALEWTIITYLKLIVTLTFMALFSYLLLISIEKIKTNS